MWDWIVERVKWLVAGRELQALHRYRAACALAWRWNGELPASADTARWIRECGDGERGMDIEQFRERLREGAKGPPMFEPGGFRAAGEVGLRDGEVAAVLKPGAQADG